MNCQLTTNYVTLNIEYLSYLQDSIDMVTNSSCHMVGRTGLTPLVDELATTQRELSAHVGITKGKDLTFLIHTLSNHELEYTILVLCDSQIGNRTRRRLELSEVTTTSLAVEYRHNLHGRLLGLRDVEVA